MNETKGSGKQRGAADNPYRPNAVPATIFHVTHWKAGSQWVYRILTALAKELIVAPRVDMIQILQAPILPGHIYPTVYLTREELESVPLPARAPRFVVIRDLRDTLVSLYFSVRVSHPMMIGTDLASLRSAVWQMTVDDGLTHLMDGELRKSSRIQESWVAAGEPLIRYEDLLERDVEILEETLIDRCGLRVGRRRLRSVVTANRFEQTTGGRGRGQEDVMSHERKGIAGDWRNHFTPRVKGAFKARFGELLIATGYESDLDW